ncbi:MAG: extracellular solute-binding protein [Roseiflexaceae bacterium]|nr:extracellular solute-binding protein [Roseiflexaceae bacterium]
MAVLLNQAGAVLCENDCTTPKFNDPKAAPVYEFLRAINKQAPPGLAFDPDEGKIYSQLFKGVSAYQIAGSWHTTWATQSGCADCQYSAVPLPEGGQDSSVVVGNVLYAVLKQSKNPDLAKEFVKLLVRDDVQDLVFPSLGRLPATKSALTKLRPTADTATQSFIDVLLNSPELNVLPQFSKNPQKVWTAYNDMLAKVLTTEEPIQTLLDEGQLAAEEASK